MTWKVCVNCEIRKPDCTVECVMQLGRVSEYVFCKWLTKRNSCTKPLSVESKLLSGLSLIGRKERIQVERSTQRTEIYARKMCFLRVVQTHKQAVCLQLGSIVASTRALTSCCGAQTRRLAPWAIRARPHAPTHVVTPSRASSQTCQVGTSTHPKKFGNTFSFSSLE